MCHHQRPYLRPNYDDPSFIIRNLWRLYAGWWDQHVAHLRPPPDADLAGYGVFPYLGEVEGGTNTHNLPSLLADRRRPARSSGSPAGRTGSCSAPERCWTQASWTWR